jgi:hypothetical protein
LRRSHSADWTGTGLRGAGESTWSVGKAPWAGACVGDAKRSIGGKEAAGDASGATDPVGATAVGLADAGCVLSGAESAAPAVDPEGRRLVSVARGALDTRSAPAHAKTATADMPVRNAP